MLHMCLDEKGLLEKSVLCAPMNELINENQCNYIIINIILITDRKLVNKKEKMGNWIALMDGSNLNLMILNHCRPKTIMSENVRLSGYITKYCIINYNT